MYYRMNSDPATQNIFLQRESHPFDMMIDGAPLPDDTATPFEFSMEVDLDEDGGVEEPHLFPFIREPCVMSSSFLATLRGAGVDNIQAFPAVLTNTRTRRQYNGYFAANVIGMVACANIAESNATPLADVYFFHDLVIDPRKTHDLLLFRLAESQMEIIVHEKVARAIRAAGHAGIVLEPLAEAPMQSP